MTTENLLDLVSEHVEAFGVGFLLLLGWVNVRSRKKHHKVAEKKLQKAIDTQMGEPLTLHPEVDPGLCAGCAACTRVCPEGDILKIINHRAVLVSPTKCVGHGECEQACPTNAISLVFGTKTRGMDIPRITSDYETNVPGLYIAGELGGMGLIRNAVKQGRLAADHALAHLPKDGAGAAVDTDLLVVGGGPAGLAAALAAIEAKRRYILIEQNSFGGTVFNFPRQKIVMTKPAELPVVGQMRFKQDKVTKEELLAFWDEARRKSGLQVREKVKFETVEKKNGVFEVKTSQGLIRAHKVILALGVRGSPRRLGLPNEDLPKVTYNLLEPEQYQGRDVAVVGGGNAGVEAAQYLGKPSLGNRVTLLVRGAGFDRCNEENQKIIRDMESRGEVKIWYQSSVAEIHPDRIQVKRESGVESLANDYLFVFAGAEMPHKMLMGFGIQIEKKFGTGLGK